MKILLVGPKSTVWNSRMHIHMGLGYLAGALIDAGYDDVTLFEAQVEDESLPSLLARERYDLVGISSPTPLIYEAWEAAGQAKERGAITVLGGPHLTLMPDESMERPEVDLVVRGEAEETLVEIVRAIEATGQQGVESGVLRLPDDPWGNVAGLTYRDLAGKVVHNVPRKLRQDIEGIPWPAYHLFKIERYTNLQPLTDGLDPHARAYTLLTSRGCPYQCIYCSKPITGNTWRARSPEDVIAEWRYLVEEMGATEIGITDDVWNLKLDRAKELCRLLIAEGLNTVPWVPIHGMRADHADAELFQLMKQAGCKRVGFGVESGNQAVLDAIKKRQTLDDVRRAFKWAREAGLQTMGFFIFGLPAETEESMEDTIRFALELDPDMANFMLAAPYPGTELWEIARRDGRLFSMNWRDYAIHDERARYELPTLPPDLVERKWREANRRFYLRPRQLWRKAKNPDTWRRLPEYVANAGRIFLGRKA
ncbi:MAG: B12-binding domain-containing radical SAM protein [Anaerolineae bacterium]|jgi:anaerobic magnesium-protoporphyrin IX monomethyl ester cyclase